MEENTLETLLPDVAVVAGNGHSSEAAHLETPVHILHGSSNGNGNGNGITQRVNGDVTAVRAASYGAPVEAGANPALFWNAPLSGQDELNWFVPPLPHSASADAQAETMLEQFGQMMNDQPRRAWLLQWNYRTRSAASAAEQAHVESEANTQLARLKTQAEREITRIDAEMTRLNAQQQTLENDFLTAQNQFAESAAKAGLHCDVTLPNPVAPPARSRWRRNNAEDANEEDAYDDAFADAPIGKINPQVVEDALNNAVPTLQEMAGEYGVGPIGHSDMLSRILSFFMQFLAPLVAGMMLALCLGTLVGILDIDTLQRSDSAPQLALSAALGFVIVYLMGELFHTSVATLARSLETRDPDLAAKPNVPRFRSNMGIALALLAVALGLGVAEVTAEGMGIRQLHQQQITKQNRFRGTTTTPTNATATGTAGSRVNTATPAPASEELPLIVYLVIGTLISGPYLAYKTAKGWGENESYLREAWLTHRQRVWLDERRAQPDVQQAFHHAYSVEQIESNLTRTRLQLQDLEDERTRALNVELPANMQSRRREARAAAVGEAARLQQSLEDLVDAHEPMPQPRPPVVRQAQSANRRANSSLRG